MYQNKTYKWLFIGTLLTIVVVSISGYFFARQHTKDPEGTLTFTIYATPEDSKLELTVGAYGESGRLFNYDLVGATSPFITTVSVPSEAYNVSIFFPGVESVYCEVIWSPVGGRVETYSQTDGWEGPAIPSCNWRRNYPNQR